jgi:sigma-B regulation protein RsbU (phosphoserine phosphatase)
MDAGLSRLAAVDLVNELLNRVRDALASDTATVLQLDDSGDELVATASRGLEEAVRQRVRVPVRGSFAGRVVAERRPVALDTVSAATVRNPVLLTAGIRSLLGAPLVAEGRVMGVVHVGSLTERRFTADDADLLRMVADRIALAIQTEQSREARTAARMLQRSLLPARLPQLPGMELAARYVPGEGESIGGDWYDLFTLPSGRFCLVMGDVAGHGLGAAVVMGRLRSALRAYALEYDDPADVLQRLDVKARHFEVGAMATVLYATFDPTLDTMRVSLAGHLPPVLASPGRSAAILDLPVDPPVGVSAVVPRRTTSVAVPAGAVICFYTDGLVERRGVSIDEGLAALCRSIRDEHPERLCAAIMTAMVGTQAPADDVALLVLRKPDTSGGPDG